MPAKRGEAERVGETEPANLPTATVIFVYEMLTFYCVLYVLPLLILFFKKNSLNEIVKKFMQ